MTWLSIIVGIVLVALSFVLMVYGQSFLGEKPAHNNNSSDKDDLNSKDDHSCVGCGSCSSYNAYFEEKIAEDDKKPSDENSNQS